MRRRPRGPSWAAGRARANAPRSAEIRIHEVSSATDDGSATRRHHIRTPSRDVPSSASCRHGARLKIDAREMLRRKLVGKLSGPRHQILETLRQAKPRGLRRVKLAAKMQVL